MNINIKYFYNSFRNKMEMEIQKTNYARTLIEASLDPLVTINSDGKVMDVNDALISITGIERENLLNTDFATYFTEPQKAHKGYLEVLQKGFIVNYHLTVKHETGKLTDVLYNASGYKDDRGNILGVFASIRDVTSQKQASQYARCLIEASLDPLVTISASGKITDVNEASIKVTGISRENLIDTDFSNYFTEPKKAQEGYEQVFEKGFVSDYPLTIKHKNGNLTDVLYNASVFKDSKGNVIGVFAAARDVTEQKWAKDTRVANKELAFQNDEKEKRAAELAIANKELAFQNDEKEKRAAELAIANKELAFQNDEKEKRAAELAIANKELAFQNDEKEKRATELGVANKELAFQNDEKEKRATELGVANKELAFQNDEKEKRAAELGIANKELEFQNDEKEKRAAELGIANKELEFQNDEKEKRAAELGIANKELEFQNDEKEKRASELGIANKELAFQNDEKEKRAAELGIANQELNQSERLLKDSLKEVSDYKDALDETTIIALTDQKGIIRKANSNFCKISKYSEDELIGQDHQILNSGYHPKEFIRDLWVTIAKGKIWKGEIKNKAKDGTFYWVDTTIVPFINEQGKPYQYLAIRVDITKRKESEEQLTAANIELAFQNNEKEKRAIELGIANKELAFQNDEKEKRATELGVANKELAFQNHEKEKRATELGVANKELAFQNDEKEKRAAELVIANKELAFQNNEKEKRAAELVIANKELEFQNNEKEMRAEELIIANKELMAFTYISSHDLQEPLRKIQTFVSIILENENNNLSENGKYNFERMQLAAGRMQQLIDDLLAFSRVATTELKFEKTELNQIIEEVKIELKDTIFEKNATIEIGELGSQNLIAFQFRQLMYNLVSNALKFSNPEIPSHIIITNRIVKGNKLNNEKLTEGKDYFHITVKDNGIGFEPHFSERIFGVFQKLHGKEIYAGTGIGLAIVKKIVENHNGLITAKGELKKGASFDIYIPAN